jgi:hypothetical protein
MRLSESNENVPGLYNHQNAVELLAKGKIIKCKMLPINNAPECRILHAKLQKLSGLYPGPPGGEGDPFPAPIPSTAFGLNAGPAVCTPFFKTAAGAGLVLPPRSPLLLSQAGPGFIVNHLRLPLGVPWEWYDKMQIKQFCACVECC